MQKLNFKCHSLESYALEFYFELKLRKFIIGNNLSVKGKWQNFLQKGVHYILNFVINRNNECFK